VKVGPHEPKANTTCDEVQRGGDEDGCCNEERRLAMIAEAAYFRSLGRNFAPGEDIEDWLMAEREVDAALLNSSGAGSSERR